MPASFDTSRQNVASRRAEAIASDATALRVICTALVLAMSLMLIRIVSAI